MNQPSVAVIGCGYWGKNLVRNFHQLGALRVICDMASERLTSLQSQYPGVAVTTDVEGVLADPAVRAVVLATPAETHYSLVKKALLAGKDVFAEKPLALHYREGEELV